MLFDSCSNDVRWPLTNIDNHPIWNTYFGHYWIFYTSVDKMCT